MTGHGLVLPDHAGTRVMTVGVPFGGGIHLGGAAVMATPPSPTPAPAYATPVSPTSVSEGAHVPAINGPRLCGETFSKGEVKEIVKAVEELADLQPLDPILDDQLALDATRATRVRRPFPVRAQTLYDARGGVFTVYSMCDVAHLAELTFRAGVRPNPAYKKLGDGIHRCLDLHSSRDPSRLYQCVYIHHLSVYHAFQRKGLGTELLQYLIRTRENAKFYLCANPDYSSTREGLHAFYTKLGFTHLDGTCIYFK